jgi:hypothetical protein
LYIHGIKINSMKLNEKDFVVGEAVVGKIPYYTDVEPELMDMRKGDRVLPAPFFYEKSVYYELYAIHEAGKPGYPKGGVEVTGHDGHRRYYELDQVILHPHVIKHKKTLDKMMRRAEKEGAKRQKQYERAQRKVEKEVGKRGRKALSPEERAQRESEKAARAIKSGGKRGRPKGSTPSTPKVYTPTGGKRGRRPLDPEVVAARAREKVARTVRSGGKRGRPKRS